jgi:hypothetical protein
VGEVGSDARRVDYIVEGKLGNEGASLEEEGQWLMSGEQWLCVYTDMDDNRPGQCLRKRLQQLP